MGSRLSSSLLCILAVALSAAGFFFGTGLHPLWYLTWVAPLPLLLIAPRVSWPIAVLTGFTGFVIGDMNMARYYLVVMPPIAMVLVIVGPALVWALCVLAFRAMVKRGFALRAALSVPAIWVAYEYLSERWSPHSTWGNLAYSQMDFVPLLQVVSLTGIWSLSFLVMLFPAAVAALCSPAAAVLDKRVMAAVTAAIYATVLLFGSWRLHAVNASPRVTVAAIANDQKQDLYPKAGSTAPVIEAYAEQVPGLASQGAQVIVMPEKIGRFAPGDVAQADRILTAAAAANHVSIVMGMQRQPGTKPDLNEARFYSANGLVATYEKHHMLPAFESDLLPGTKRVLLPAVGGKYGLTICKDMDFPKLSREYGKDGAGLMLVPAWDFVEDGWLHGRMAILRGVESGFNMVRAPKQGVLTLSDSRGRIVAQAATSDHGFVSVVGSLPITNERTLYAQAGDWFPVFDLALLIGLLYWMLWPTLRSAQ